MSIRSLNVRALLAAGWLLVPPHAHAVDAPSTNAPVSFHLVDQFGSPKSCEYPKTNITVLVVADKKGCESIDGWIQPIKAKYGAEIDLVGLADLPDVPGVFRGMVVGKFKRQMKYPVGLDWKGEVSRSLRAVPEKPNVFVIGIKGGILLHVAGDATERSMSNVFHTIAGAETSKGTAGSGDPAYRSP